MTLDDILIHIGEFGRYQKWVYFLFALPYTPYAMQLFGWVFVGAKLEHRCRIPGEPEGAGFDLNGTRYNVETLCLWSSKALVAVQVWALSRWDLANSAG